jgi:peptidoglycan/LPS O-acetylase OafA/YrhL
VNGSRTVTRSGALDGLRGFAAAAVVSSHLTLSMGLIPYDSGGFIGVLAFFVLSGYLITGVCWKAEPAWSSYRAFVRRRVQRLGPVVLALAVVGTPALVLFGQQPVGDALAGAGLALSQLTAFAITLGMEWHPAWSPTWSLTVEWAFYLLFPLAVIVARKRGTDARAVRNIAIAAAAMLYAGGLALSNEAFYLLPVANLGVMLAGAALALAHQTTTREGGWRLDPAWPVFALVLLMVIVVIPGATLGIGYKLVTLPFVTGATVLVIHGCRQGSAVARVLGWRPLRAIGLRAYSVYLWHMPVFWLVWVNAPDASKWVRAAVALVVLVPVAGLSYWALERPIMQSRAPAVPHGATPPLRVDRQPSPSRG